jgi:hypothetical protein
MNLELYHNLPFKALVPLGFLDVLAQPDGIVDGGMHVA